MARNIAQTNRRALGLRILRERYKDAQSGRVDECQRAEVDRDRAGRAFERGTEGCLEVGSAGQVDVAVHGQDTRGAGLGILDLGFEPIGHGCHSPVSRGSYVRTRRSERLSRFGAARPWVAQGYDEQEKTMAVLLLFVSGAERRWYHW